MSPDPSRALQDRIREAAQSIGRRDEIRLILLFGSAADPTRGCPRDGGVAIQGRTCWISSTSANRFGEETGVQEIDLVDLRRADPVLLAEVARDDLPLYEAEPGGFARFASLAFRRAIASPSNRGLGRGGTAVVHDPLAGFRVRR
jgi:hypothetical protein